MAKVQWQYQALCGLFLSAVFLADLQQGVVLLSLLLFLLGLLGVLSPSRLALSLFLIGLAGTQLFKQFGYRRLGVPWHGDRPGLRAEDVFLCLAVLGYLIAHYRWQGLVHNILPLDRRRREQPGRWPYRTGRVLPQRRPAEQINRKEISLLVLGLPAWALLAQALWSWLRNPPDLQGLQPGPARLVIVAWFIVVGTLLARAVLVYWQRRQDSPQIAALVLQDILWKETRREQRRHNRWLAWRRNRETASERRSS